MVAYGRLLDAPAERRHHIVDAHPYAAQLRQDFLSGFVCQGPGKENGIRIHSAIIY
jgi:hypothetical protein